MSVIVVSHYFSTGNGYRLAVHRFLPAKPNNRICYFIGSDKPTLGIGFDQFGKRLFPCAPRRLNDLIERSLHNIGVGVTGADCVDGDAFAGVLECQRARKPDDAVLGRTVGGNLSIAYLSRRARDIDDAA